MNEHEITNQFVQWLDTGLKVGIGGFVAFILRFWLNKRASQRDDFTAANDSYKEQLEQALKRISDLEAQNERLWNTLLELKNEGNH